MRKGSKEFSLLLFLSPSLFAEQKDSPLVRGGLRGLD